MKLEFARVAATAWLSLALGLSAGGAGCGGGDSTPTDAVDGESGDGSGEGDGRVEDGRADEAAAVNHDGDGYPEGEDCDDTDFSVHPDAPELCNGVDDDCDGETDEESSVDAPTWYPDADRDGFGNSDAPRRACRQPTGYVADADDCDDGSSEVNPDGTEACNGVDDDCNGETDEGDAVGSLAWYADDDGDGFGDTAREVLACSMPAGSSPIPGDCNDSSATVNPGAAETCNGIDDNCDTVTDEPTAIDAGHWYADTDGDGFGNPGTEVVACMAPDGFVADASDCDDADFAVNPAVDDVPDGASRDENCDGIDGDIDRSIFVSRSWGSDYNTGLGEWAGDSLVVEPVRSLRRGLERAVAKVSETGEAWDVLVATGTYREGSDPIDVEEGIDIFGGYDAGWAHTAAPEDTVVTGTGGFAVVRADAITLDTQIGFLTVLGASALPTAEWSTAVLVTNTPTEGRLTFRAVRIVAGEGGPGEPGAAPGTATCGRCEGAVALTTYSTSCSQAAPSATTAAGCAGSPGGAVLSCADTCACYFTASTGNPGFVGGAGAVPAGNSADPAARGTFGTDGTWLPPIGTSGAPGGRGGGGGAGGYGQMVHRGGCAGADAGGGPGGGGGAGGCGGDGGVGGRAGGGSFGLVLVDSRVRFGEPADGEGVTIRLGTGGDGGAGGEAGDGLAGAAGTTGRLGQELSGGSCVSYQGGPGGRGGNGGCGAGGAGGNGGSGGPAVGLALVDVSATTVVMPGVDGAAPTYERPVPACDGTGGGALGGTGGAGGSSPCGAASPAGAAGAPGVCMDSTAFSL